MELVIDDKGYLTDYRTGIAGAIATKTLANPSSKTVAVIGNGTQARMQIQSLLKVMPSIKNLNVYGRNKNKVIDYCNEMKKLYSNISVKYYETVKETVENADIIYTVTYSENPLLKKEWIKKGSHITAIGACGPNMQELEEEILLNADLVVADSIEATSTHGELNNARRKGFDICKAKELGKL